jgi:ferredoxin
MPTITFLPSQTTISVEPTCTLRDAVHAAGLSVQDHCGGMGACGSCAVAITEGQHHLNPKTAAEDATFYLTEHERLACQCIAQGDVTITL